jgi:hypothetical protein
MKTAIAIFFAAFLLCGCQKPATDTRWQYRVFEMENMYKYSPEKISSFDSTEHFNDFEKLGTNGWELVSATPLLETTYPESARPFIRTEKVLLIFKKQL